MYICRTLVATGKWPTSVLGLRDGGRVRGVGGGGEKGPNGPGLDWMQELEKGELGAGRSCGG